MDTTVTDITERDTTKTYITVTDTTKTNTTVTDITVTDTTERGTTKTGDMAIGISEIMDRANMDYMPVGQAIMSQVKVTAQAVTGLTADMVIEAAPVSVVPASASADHMGQACMGLDWAVITPVRATSTMTGRRAPSTFTFSFTTILATVVRR